MGGGDRSLLFPVVADPSGPKPRSDLPPPGGQLQSKVMSPEPAPPARRFVCGRVIASAFFAAAAAAAAAAQECPDFPHFSAVPGLSLTAYTFSLAFPWHWSCLSSLQQYPPVPER